MARFSRKHCNSHRMRHSSRLLDLRHVVGPDEQHVTAVAKVASVELSAVRAYQGGASSDSGRHHHHNQVRCRIDHADPDARRMLTVGSMNARNPEEAKPIARMASARSCLIGEFSKRIEGVGRILDPTDRRMRGAAAPDCGGRALDRTDAQPIIHHGPRRRSC